MVSAESILSTVSILVAACLIVGCIKRIKVSLNELTDKTLPEEQQMKILKALNRHFDSYLQIHSIDSRKIGKITRIDIKLSFENDTRVEEVLSLQQQIQNELGEQIDECIVNIIMHSEQTKS